MDWTVECTHFVSDEARVDSDLIVRNRTELHMPIYSISISVQVTSTQHHYDRIQSQQPL